MATPNKPITLAPVNVSANEGTIDLPEVNVEANAPLPAGHINVMSPEGVMGQMPLENFLKEGVKEGFTLPTKEPDITVNDLTPDKQIKVIRKSDGMQGLIPLDQYLQNPDEAKDYEIASKYDPEYQKKVNQDLKDLTNAGWSQIDDRHRNDDIQDDSGNYKLLDPNGNTVLVERKYLTPLLSSGFKFADQNFQSLFEANRQLASDIETASTVAGSEAAGSVPGIGSLITKLNEKFGTKAAQANLIALDIAKQKEQKTAATIGTAAGIVAQLGLPSGVFGEMKLGQAAKAGILAKLAPEGASLGRSLLAKGLGMGVEGAIISSPQAIAKLAIDKDPTAAAESLVLGFGVGAGLGVGGTLLAKGGEAALGLVGKVGEKFTEGRVANVLEQSGINQTRELTQNQIERGVVSAGGKLEVAIPEGEKFIQKLRDEGIKSTSKVDEIFDVSRKLAQGNGMESTLAKLDKLGSSGTSASDLISKFKSSAQELAQNFPEISSKLLGKFNAKLEELSENISSLADKEGNLSLENLKKFITNVGEDTNWKKLRDSLAETEERIFSPMDELKSYLWNDAREAMISGIDKLSEGADAKLVAELSEKRLMQQMSRELFSHTIMSGANGELSPIAKKVMDLLAAKGASKLGMVVGGVAGSVGGVLGSTVGSAAGSAAGSLVNKLTGPAVENISSKLVDAYEQNSGSKIVNWLVKNKTANAIGSYIAIDSIKNMESKIAEIPGFIKDIGNATAQGAKVASIKVPIMFIGSKDPIKSILGSEANGLSKAQQFQRLSTKVANMNSNPTMKQQQYDLHIAPLFKDHPELAQQVQANYDKKIQVVNQILNTGNTQQPAAFTKQKPYQPTPAQMAEIENKLKVVENPYALLDGLKNGKVTSAQVAIVAQLNPAILQKMQNEIAKQAFSGKTALPYQQRLAASTIMGAPMDPSVRNGSALQATYGQSQAQAVPAGQEPHPQKQGNSKPIKAEKIAKYSLSQRIASV